MSQVTAMRHEPARFQAPKCTVFGERFYGTGGGTALKRRIVYAPRRCAWSKFQRLRAFIWCTRFRNWALQVFGRVVFGLVQFDGGASRMFRLSGLGSVGSGVRGD